MASRRTGRMKSTIGAGVLGLLAVGMTSYSLSTAGHAPAGPAPDDLVDTAVVRRMDLDTMLLAGGDLMPARQTAVTCEVEDVDRGTAAGGEFGTTILSIVPNGAAVKKGDVLCVLDSSGFDERLRKEQIDVESARSDCRHAELTVETSRVALREYRDGTVVERTKEFESRSALLRSDFEGQRAHVAWAGRMFDKGYYSRAAIMGARQALARIEHDRNVADQEARVFRDFTAPKEVRRLESEVEGAQATFGYQSTRLKALEERLASLRKQAGCYTIRAPHDGMVVYPPMFEWRDRPLRPGLEVFQHEELLFLPDLSRIEVEVSIHESKGAGVRLGMPAEVRITAQPGRIFFGKIDSLESLPRVNYKGWEMRLNYFARVRLDETPDGVLPFMSAEVRIDTGRVENALVIPPAAIATDDGRSYCDLRGPNGTERRAIAIGRSTPEFVEVTSGLHEGERVALHPRPVRTPGVL